ncbi:MAG: hypothetical protein ABIH92_00720, partial [Nanoarchaeota archaeon]
KETTEISELMHYLSFLGLMFNGIHLTHYERFKEADECFNLALKTMKKGAFHNRSISDIYLATRFFSAQNMHKWGNHVLEETHNDIEAMKLYDEAAKSFFLRAKEMQKLHDIDKDDQLEHSLLYGIYMLTKEGKYKQAERKLNSIRRKFNKENLYLFYLYKGYVQKDVKKAVPYFDKAKQHTKNEALVDEKIADYFFSRGKFKDSIKYFEERLKLTSKQIYSPELLEESAHQKLCVYYMKEANLAGSVRERIIARINESKNIDKEKEQ